MDRGKTHRIGQIPLRKWYIHAVLRPRFTKDFKSLAQLTEEMAQPLKSITLPDIE
jgi:hypothetical protein